MSSSARLNRLMADAWNNNDATGVLDAYNDYQAVNCYYPFEQEVFDAHTQTMRKIMVACGICDHCRQSKINEWCTRMYAHAEDFKHIYFVTLTYRSFYDDSHSVNKLMLDKLKQAVWHRDAKNSTHRLSYNPCLLVKKHYQDFMKRLRKYSGLNDITYVLSGEYGHEYGRPHFHIILFTNGDLTSDVVKRAWSVALWQNNKGEFSYKTSQKNNGTAFYFPIGRVDFHNLVTNGTLNTTCKIRVDGTYMNAANCFAYVCKYVCKQDTANLDRVRLAYNNLFKKESFYRIFDNEVPCKIAEEWLREHGYYGVMVEQVLNSQNLLHYDKVSFQPSDRVYKQGLSNQKTTTLYCHEFIEPVYPSTYFEFRDLFRPFCEFSRATPIGSIYAKRNIQEFAQGVFTKPLLQDKGYILPRYFARKAEEYLYGLRVCHSARSGNTFVLGGLPNLLGRFTKSLETKIPPREYFTPTKSHLTTAQALHHPTRVLADFSTGEKILLKNGCAHHYKYNRHTRSYDNTRNIAVADFIRYWCDRIRDEIARHDLLIEQAKANKSSLERAELIALDFGFDKKALRDRFVAKREEQIKEQQRLYHSQHQSAE